VADYKRFRDTYWIEKGSTRILADYRGNRMRGSGKMCSTVVLEIGGYIEGRIIKWGSILTKWAPRANGLSSLKSDWKGSKAIDHYDPEGKEC